MLIIVFKILYYERINKMKICVFGASSEQIEKIYIDTAESLGRAIANRGDAVIYGAGKYGVMGATARGVTSEKGELIGVAPEFSRKTMFFTTSAQNLFLRTQCVSVKV